jgi:predicted phage terminase large subunit-like protein
MHASRHTGNKDFEAVYFRRVMPEITNAGGLWDEALKLYAGIPKRESPRLQLSFPSGATVTFSHMQHSSDRFSWDGSQIPGIYFDQLEAFEEDQFWHMVGRNRSTCGVRPYIRASCNPKPGSWLMAFIQWWWDEATGYPIPARSGVVRWFVRDPDGNEIHWANTPEELASFTDSHTGEPIQPKSFTFVFASIYDNLIALKLNPERLSNLLQLPFVERERRLRGNMKIADYSGDGLFKPEWWKMLPLDVWQEIQAKPTENFRWARGWDPAGGQSKGSDYSSGALVGHAKDKEKDKRIIIGNITRGQWSPGIRNRMMAATARADEKFEPGFYFWKSRTPDMNRSILEDAEISAFGFWAITERGRKYQRAQRLAVQAEAGNVWLAPGDWNAEFIREAAMFKDEDSDEVRKDDQVDCVCLSDSQLVKWN